MFPRLNNFIVFAIGVILGSILALILFHSHLKIPDKVNTKSVTTIYNNYEHLLQEDNIHRTLLLMDDIRYGNTQNITIESEYLYNKINVLCVVLVHKLRNVEAINNTWGQKCNKIIFYSLKKLKISTSDNIQVIQYSVSSSWELLCSILQHIQRSYEYSWAFFINDDLFAIVENLRLFLAKLDHNKMYYIGHSIKFWGVTHNVAEAGYVLSRKSIEYLTNKFSNETECKNGGRYWKQEAYYLGL